MSKQQFSDAHVDHKKPVKRIPIACERCRKRKIRCTGDLGDQKGCQICREVQAGGDVGVICRYNRSIDVDSALATLKSSPPPLATSDSPHYTDLSVWNPTLPQAPARRSDVRSNVSSTENYASADYYTPSSYPGLEGHWNDHVPTSPHDQTSPNQSGRYDTSFSYYGRVDHNGLTHRNADAHAVNQTPSMNLLPQPWRHNSYAAGMNFPTTSSPFSKTPPVTPVNSFQHCSSSQYPSTNTLPVWKTPQNTAGLTSPGSSDPALYNSTYGHRQVSAYPSSGARSSQRHHPMQHRQATNDWTDSRRAPLGHNTQSRLSASDWRQ